MAELHDTVKMMELPASPWGRVRELMTSGREGLAFLAHQITNLWANTILQWRDSFLFLCLDKYLVNTGSPSEIAQFWILTSTSLQGRWK